MAAVSTDRKGICGMFWMRWFVGRPALATIVLALTCAGAGGVAGARAGEYHVYSCRMPNGEVAPTDGWSASATGVAVYAEDKCAKGGALVAALGDGVSHGVGTDTATWTFTPPSGETLSEASLWRAGDAEGGAVANATYEFWLAGPAQPEAFGSCVYISGCMKVVGEPEEPLSASNLLPVPGANLGEHLYVNASCGGLQTYKCPSGKGDPNGYAAVVYLYAADLTLSQTSQPTVTSVEGELATASTLSGSADLSFHATDPGSGVYQAVFTVDGSEVGRTVLDSSSSCHDVGQTTDGLPAFLYLQPCSPSLSADLQFDTTALTDGTHHLVVSVTNAAGNSTVALDRKITVLNHPLPPASPPSPTTPQPSPEGQERSNASKNEQQSPSSPVSQSQGDNATAASAGATLDVHWATTAHASLAGSYGHPQVVLGRLASAGGSPIGGVTVEVLSTPSFVGAHTIALADAHTASDGSFRVRLPSSTPSTHLTFAYSPTPSSPVPQVTASLDLSVPARLTLRVTPRVTHRGGTIVFSGVLSGTSLPPGGKQLVLEARTLSGPWRQFHVLSTAVHGRFRATYRFRLSGPIDYEFRCVSAREADFPYATGSSAVVLVRER
jgi:hypothetical protein